MYVGAASLAPRKFSPITGRDHIYGERRYLGGLAAANPAAMFTPAQISALGPNMGFSSSVTIKPAGFASNAFGGGYAYPPQRIVNFVSPAWYTGGTYPHSGYTDPNTNPVLVKQLKLPDGSPAWWVPGTWSVGGGWQQLTPSAAIAAGGIPISQNLNIETPQGKTLYVRGSYVDPLGYLFAYDPWRSLQIGLASGTYTPGPNVGKQNIRDVATGLTIVAGVMVGGAAAAGALAPAAGAGAAVAPEAIAPGAFAVTSGAPVVAAAVPAIAAPVAAAGGGILGTGITTAQVSAVLGAAKTAYGLSQQAKQNAEQAASAGNVPLANQNAMLATQYQNHGDDLMSTLNQPVVGGIPLWLLALGAVAAKLAFF